VEPEPLRDFPRFKTIRNTVVDNPMPEHLFEPCILTRGTKARNHKPSPKAINAILKRSPLQPPA
jgi:hypothetical protein